MQVINNSNKKSQKICITALNFNSLKKLWDTSNFNQTCYKHLLGKGFHKYYGDYLKILISQQPF